MRTPRMLSPETLDRQPRAHVLPGVLLCIILATVSASMPAKGNCPAHIDCAREGRHFCKPGSSHCGPCLTPLEENEMGKCEIRRRHVDHHHHHAPEKVVEKVVSPVSSFPTLDEEIDYLQAVIAKQQVSRQPVASSPARPPPPPPPEKESPTQRNQTHPSSGGHPGPTTTPQAGATGAGQGRAGPGGPGAVPIPPASNDGILIILVSVCILGGTVALILAGVCYIRVAKEQRLAQKVDYPAFGAPPPLTNSGSYMDKTLAQNAQMYHYQHQKQQMLSLGKHKTDHKAHDHEATSDEEEVGGDFTVYECPGLAPTGEMEVKNPLFDDSTLHYQGNNK